MKKWQLIVSSNVFVIVVVAFYNSRRIGCAIVVLEIAVSVVRFRLESQYFKFRCPVHLVVELLQVTVAVYSVARRTGIIVAPEI